MFVIAFTAPLASGACANEFDGLFGAGKDAGTDAFAPHDEDDARAEDARADGAIADGSVDGDGGADADATLPSGPAVLHQKGFLIQLDVSSQTATVNLDPPVPPGHMLIVGVATSTSNPVVSVSAGSLVLNPTVSTGVAGPAADVRYAVVPSNFGMVNSVKVTMNTYSLIGVWVLDAVGVSSYVPANGTEASSSSLDTSPLKAPPVSGSPPPMLVVSVAGYGGSISGPTAGTGFTEVGLDKTPPGSGMRAAYRTVSEVGTWRASWDAQTGYAYGTVTAAFSPVAP